MCIYAYIYIHFIQLCINEWITIIVIGVISQLLLLFPIIVPMSHLSCTPQVAISSISRFNVPEWSWSAPSPSLHWQEGRSLSSTAAGGFLPGAARLVQYVQWTYWISRLPLNFLNCHSDWKNDSCLGHVVFVLFGIWNVASCALISFGYSSATGRTCSRAVRARHAAVTGGHFSVLLWAARCLETRFATEVPLWKHNIFFFALATMSVVSCLFRKATSCVYFHLIFMGGMRFIFMFGTLSPEDSRFSWSYGLFYPFSLRFFPPFRAFWTRIGGSYLDDFVIKGLPAKAAMLRHSMGWSLRAADPDADVEELGNSARFGRSGGPFMEVPKMVGLYHGKFPWKWMMTGGTPILGTPTGRSWNITIFL